MVVGEGAKRQGRGGVEGQGVILIFCYGPIHAACIADWQQGKHHLESWMLDSIAFM